MWLKNEKLQRQGGGWSERLGVSVVSTLQMVALGAHKKKHIMQLLRRVRKERRSLVTSFEAFTVYSVARCQSQMTGDFAEVGVYEGSTARLICEAKGDKVLRLFDTFAGLPKATEPDRTVHRENQYACSLKSVRDYLQDFENVSLYKGLFPESTADVPESKYSFVHFDVDLYESTKACLEYFYTRMVSGGIILSHDYSLLTGVEQAFDEFLTDKPEELIEMPTTQCMVVKQTNTPV